MNYIKPKKWDGKDLVGIFAFTIKLDGVRMLRNDKGEPVSRNGNRLYGLDGVPDYIVDAEIFAGDWDKSITAVKTHDAPAVNPAWVFSLFPAMDARLFLGLVENPTAHEINKMMEELVAQGHEGLVVRDIKDNTCYKVKPMETHDVKVLRIEEGKGKNVGRMGSLVTTMGKVGTGFSDEVRHMAYLYPEKWIGKTVEVKCMSLTKKGVFRHARFIRLREDK